MEHAIQTHSGRRRQSQLVASGTLGPGVGERRPAQGGSYRTQTGLFNQSQATQTKAAQPTGSQRAVNPMLGGAASSQTGQWSSDADPSEIPAFLRRRDDGGFAR